MRLKKSILAAGVLVSAVGLLSVGVRPARADTSQTYTFKENLHVGQVIPCTVVNTATYTYPDSNTTSESKNYCKLTITTTEVKDGSTTACKVLVDPDSYVLTKNTGDLMTTKTPSAYCGKTISVRRRSDETVIDDFKGNPDAQDKEIVDSCVDPDEDYFPDEPVSVGDTWDATAKARKHAELLPGDQFTAQVRLDWVKKIDGKMYASMTCASAVIRHNEDKSEDDQVFTSTFIVDVAAGQIVKGTQDGKQTSFTTGPGAAVTSRGVFHYDMSITGAAPSTEPSVDAGQSLDAPPGPDAGNATASSKSNGSTERNTADDADKSAPVPTTDSDGPGL